MVLKERFLLEEIESKKFGFSELKKQSSTDLSDQETLKKVVKGSKKEFWTEKNQSTDCPPLEKKVN